MDLDQGQDEEEEEDEPPPPETRIEAEIPKINTDLGREIHFVKLPNFLSVETRPFEPDLYEDELDEEETLDEEGRARWDAPLVCFAQSHIETPMKDDA